MPTPAGKYFFAVSRLNGLVLDISDSCTKPGTLVCMKERKVSLNENQLWYEDIVTGTIRSKLNETLCLDINDDKCLVVDVYDPRLTSQRWQKGGTRRDRLEHGTETGRFLEVDSNRRRSQVLVTPFKQSDHQRWNFDHVDTEYFHLVSEVSGRALDVRGGSKRARAAVVCLKFNGCGTQQWYEDIRGGIRSRYNDFDLSVPSLKSGSGFCLEPHQEGLQYQNQLWTRTGNKVVNMFNPHMVLDGQECDEDTHAVNSPYKECPNQHWKFPGVWEKYGKKLF